MKGVSGNPALDAYQRMAVSPVSSAKPQAKPQATEKPEPGSEAAQVSISAKARNLATQSTQQLDVQKVEALKAQIQQGTFQVDPAAVAQKLVHALG